VMFNSVKEEEVLWILWDSNYYIPGKIKLSKLQLVNIMVGLVSKIGEQELYHTM